MRLTLAPGAGAHRSASSGAPVASAARTCREADRYGACHASHSGRRSIAAAVAFTATATCR